MQRKSIGLLNVETRQFEVIQTRVSDPVALTSDVARGVFYWADSHGNIYKSDGKQSWTIYTGELPSQSGHSCDRSLINLYHKCDEAPEVTETEMFGMFNRGTWNQGPRL